jgi:cytochrome c
MFKLSAAAAAVMMAMSLSGTDAALAQGDAAAGERVFRQCQACHVIDAEQNRVGPHLVGIIGRPAGAVEGFKYSDAMANSGIVWDETTIAEYLANPRTYVEGNRMAFAGLRNEQQIADVIAYIVSKQ